MSSKPEDFAAEVLASLHKRKVTFRGLKPGYLEIYVDGTVKVWFTGIGLDGLEQAKGIKIMDTFPIQQSIHFGNPDIIAQLCEQIIDQNSARFY